MLCVDRPGYTDEPNDSGFNNLVEGCILAQCIVAASKFLRGRNQSGELTCDIQSATQHWQIVDLASITAWHAVTQSVNELSSKQLDQNFEKRFTLKLQVGNHTALNPHFERDGEHMDEAPSDMAIRRRSSLSRGIDFRQYLEGAILGHDNADDTPRA